MENGETPPTRHRATDGRTDGRAKIPYFPYSIILQYIYNVLRGPIRTSQNARLAKRRRGLETETPQRARESHARLGDARAPLPFTHPPRARDLVHRPGRT